MKTSEATRIDRVSADDFVVIVNDPTGAAETSVIRVGDFFANSSINVHVANIYFDYHGTPSTSTDTVAQGKIWFDDNYLYVAIDDNSIKRIALSSF